MPSQPFSTGLDGLDDVLTGLRPGDNVVWQVESVEEYVPFVRHFCSETARRRQHLVYFRFASHAPLVPPDAEAEVCQLHPDRGFEDFISEIFDVVERVGVGGCYVFDCLSDLAVDWCSDRMLGSFFQLTCPYLYDYETVAYFALLRDRHTRKATDAVHGTAQVVIDAYRSNGKLYVHPLKVYKRHSETMHMLHGWQGDEFVPVTQSATITEILASAPQPWLDFTIQRADLWTRAFREAADLVDAARGGPRDAERERQSFEKLLRMAVTRDPRLAALARQYLDLSDLVEIGKRMIGTGQIGGKAVGMLLARAILKKTDPRWEERIEPHDSFYIGSDVFYTYLIQNDTGGPGGGRHSGGKRPAFDARPLNELADETGGRAVIVTGLDHYTPGSDEAPGSGPLKAGVESIALTLRHRYLLGYEPPAGKREWRTIHVDVDRPEATARARRGYYAEE